MVLKKRVYRRRGQLVLLPTLLSLVVQMSGVPYARAQFCTDLFSVVSHSFGEMRSAGLTQDPLARETFFKEKGLEGEVESFRDRFLRQKTLRDCVGAGKCTMADMRESVLSVFSRARQARGYAVLISIMLASSALTTYLTSHLPPKLQFLSHFLAQFSVLGVYIIGAPIWEPAASRIRQWSFSPTSLGTEKNQRIHEVFGRDPAQLEKIWGKTQSDFSLNAQMTRKIFSLILISLDTRIHRIADAYLGGRKEQAALQLATLILEFDELYSDFPSDHPIVIRSVKAAFSFDRRQAAELKEASMDFIRQILLEDRGLDLTREEESRFEEILNSWLKPGEES